MPSFTFHLATAADLGPVRDLLRAVRLPASDVAPGRQEFVLAREGGRLVGSVGIEVHGRDGLLRSLAVAADLRGRGLGGSLHERALELAASRGVHTIYLLTVSAERFFADRGYDRVARESVPEALHGTPEFKGLCPKSAVCMRRELSGEARHRPGPRNDAEPGEV